MYLKCENFAVTTGTTTECWPLVTNNLKAQSLMLTATTGVTFYLGGSAMTIANGFPVRPLTATSDEDTTPAMITLNGETLGWANAQLDMNDIYVRTTSASQTIYGLYFRRDEDD